MALCGNAILTSALPAQTVSGIATLPGSTRAAGMGGGGAAIVGDAGALFGNPAGPAPVPRLPWGAGPPAGPAGPPPRGGAPGPPAGPRRLGPGAAPAGTAL